MPLHTQLASIPAWDDDRHVEREPRVCTDRSSPPFCPSCAKCSKSMHRTRASTSGRALPDDERFTRELFERQHVTLLPGTYIARDIPQGNPGRGRVRISLVANVPECTEAAHRIRDFVRGDAGTTDVVRSASPSVRSGGHQHEHFRIRTLLATIDAAFERRAELGPKNAPADVRDAVDHAIALLDSGKARVAEKRRRSLAGATSG